MISLEEALNRILTTVEPLPAVETGLDDGLGLVLAAPIVSRDAVPSFDNSAMDGYAVRSADIVGASAESAVRLEVVADVKAGDVADIPVEPGQAVRIMTGAPVPAGADAVVRVEDTMTEVGRVRAAFERAANASEILSPVLVLRSIPAGRNVRLTGEDVEPGETVLTSGQALGPAEIGLLASLGFSRVPVYRRPRVAVITTGDELLEIDQPLVLGKIRNSNAYSLAAQIRQAGAEPVRYEIAADTPVTARKLFERALAECDVLLTTGGVSVGEYDYVKDVLSAIGAEQVFWGVAQKPGKPLGYWTSGGRYIFGLPGNPVAAMVCFEEYVRPALRRLMGHALLFRPAVTAVLAADIRKRPGRVHLIRVRVANKEGGYVVDSTGPQGSGILRSMVLADGLAFIPAELESLPAGAAVTVHLITQPEDH